MDESKVEELKQRLKAMRRQSEELIEQAGDFPAVAKNTARIQASLAMMEIGLGLITVPESEGQAE